jgi:predicted DNA-binding protein YlxM (UPF0122 family)
MNLELINEIVELKSKNLSYTEIAEVIGISRTTIVLSFRLYSVLENHYSSKLSSLQENFNQLVSQNDALKNQCNHKNSEIDRLTELVNIDENVSVVLSKDEYYGLENGLTDLEREVTILNNELVSLNNMSFSQKLEWLFIPKEIK